MGIFDWADIDVGKMQKYADYADSIYIDYHNLSNPPTVSDLMRDSDFINRASKELLNTELFDEKKGKTAFLKPEIMNKINKEWKEIYSGIGSQYVNTIADRQTFYEHSLRDKNVAMGINEESLSGDEMLFVNKVLDSYYEKSGGPSEDSALPNAMYFTMDDGSKRIVSPYELVGILAGEYPDDPLKRMDFFEQGGKGWAIIEQLQPETPKYKSKKSREKTEEERLMEYYKSKYGQ